MGKTLLKRLGLLLGTLLLVSVLAFAAFSVVPGDPAASVLGSGPARLAAVWAVAGRLRRRRLRPVL